MWLLNFLAVYIFIVLHKTYFRTLLCLENLNNAMVQTKNIFVVHNKLRNQNLGQIGQRVHELTYVRTCINKQILCEIEDKYIDHTDKKLRQIKKVNSLLKSGRFVPQKPRFIQYKVRTLYLFTQDPFFFLNKYLRRK